MATFNGASFRILHGGHQRKREAAVSVRHIPGSDMSYVDLGGRMAGGGSYSVYFESYGQYTALLAQIGQQGSLVSRWDVHGDSDIAHAQHALSRRSSVRYCGVCNSMSSIVRTPFLRVLINGVALPQVLSADVQFGFDQRTARASVNVPTAEGLQAWSDVQIDIGASQSEQRLRFRGLLVDINYDLWPRAVTLQCRGPLYRAEYTRQSNEGGMSFAASGLGTPDEDQVSTVLSECGITDMDIDGTGVAIGSIAIDEVVWEEGQTGLAYIERLDEVSLGFRTYDAPGGTVIRRQVSPRPAATAALTFTEGVDIFSASRQRTPVDTYNRAMVTGYDNGDGPVFAYRQQASPSLPPGIEFRTMELSSNLIERTDEGSPGAGLTAAEIAEWKVLENNILRERVPFDTPRGDLIVPGMTIQVQSPERLQTSANYWVQSVTASYSTAGEFTQSIIAIGGPGSTSDIEAPPLIDFSFRVEREMVYIEGSLAPIYIVYAEDASAGQAAEIVARNWSIPGGNPSSGEGLTFTTALTSLSGAELTLTVEDSNGATATRTKSVNVPEEEIKRRRVFTAAEVAMEAFDGNDWRVDTPNDSAAVSEVAHGPLWIAGAYIYRSPSLLADGHEAVIPFGEEQEDPQDPEETIIVPTANPTAIWAELDADENLVMAGASDGRVAVSQDGGGHGKCAKGRRPIQSSGAC
jgi:hypothetical protein